ncbi:MAG: hypothetical protein IJ608_08885 [Lachnospiraceae bacterium]|nr:hypothetical protein [Lachnospiraceae bacterium]
MEDTEKLVQELIVFLQKWGLWEGTTILANKNRYAYSSDVGKTYQDLTNVEYEENVEPETYTTGITEQTDCNGKPVCRSFSNPEHILDMVYEGALYMLLAHGTYETEKSEISKEAWEYIFANTNILMDYMYEKYDCINASDLLKKILNDKFDNPEFTAWDPLVFDTWEEYQEFADGEAYITGEEELTPAYQRYGTYEEYLADMEISESLKVEDIEPVWEQMVRDAKREFIKDCSTTQNEIISLPELAGYIQSEFDKIFNRYELWYDFGFSWSLTCYRK